MVLDPIHPLSHTRHRAAVGVQDTRQPLAVLEVVLVNLLALAAQETLGVILQLKDTQAALLLLLAQAKEQRAAAEQVR